MGAFLLSLVHAFRLGEPSIFRFQNVLSHLMKSRMGAFVSSVVSLYHWKRFHIFVSECFAPSQCHWVRVHLCHRWRVKASTFPFDSVLSHFNKISCERISVIAYVIPVMTCLDSPAMVRPLMAQ